VTLIEVMIALVILAVGLLSLEALGIGASRMVNRAARQSQYVAMATDTLEQYIGRIRAGETVSSRSGSLPGGATMQVGVTTSGRLQTVTVSVRPPAGSRLLAARDSFRISANVYQ
jgi:Tfp pilus assembly protein PilV